MIAVSCGVVRAPLWYTIPNIIVRRDTQKMSYESVKKPVPATRMARIWYQPKGALSISASARRRRSFGSSMWAKSYRNQHTAQIPVSKKAYIVEVVEGTVASRSLVSSSHGEALPRQCLESQEFRRGLTILMDKGKPGTLWKLYTEHACPSAHAYCDASYLCYGSQ